VTFVSGPQFTLSNAAVESLTLAWLVTASPTKTSLPIAIVADPTGLGEVFTATLPKAADDSFVFVWLVTANSRKTSPLIAIVAEPTAVQTAPSAEIDPVSVVPLRTSLTQ
jgi:hypothetical protein